TNEKLFFGSGTQLSVL
ncbi:hCG2039515, partial [Homo sapiens]|uniref:T cell receptor beta joining 1-4 n=2 Tax=Homo sapiens TaxID=9606 RepID=TJB14_HUMAN